MKRILSFRDLSAAKSIACQNITSLYSSSRQKCLLYGTLTQNNKFVSNDLSLLSTSGRTSCLSYLPIRDFHSTTKELSVSSIFNVRNVFGDRKSLLEHPLCCNVFLNQQQWASRWSNKKSLNQESDKRQNLTRSSSPTLQGRGNSTKDESKESAASTDAPEKLSLYQRFKKTYKEHGKVLIGVHCLTSAFWLGSFYGVAAGGLDIVPLLEWLNTPEIVLSKLRSGGGNLAVAYILYKVATPARYTVTIGGTNLAIRYLYKAGKMKPVPQENKLRSLYKEGKADLKTKRDVRLRRYKNNSRVVKSYRKMKNSFESRKRKYRS